MSKIFVAGLLNVETSVKVEKFPIQYAPIFYPFFGVTSAVSGVAMNIACALSKLDDKIQLVSLLGDDAAGTLIRGRLDNLAIDSTYVKNTLKASPESVVLFDSEGKRQIYCDLKDIQETKYPDEKYNEDLGDCDIACICNINFARPFLEVAKKKGKTIATDVQVLSNVNDAYNADFMRYADILFVSGDCMGESPESFVHRIADTYHNKIIVAGLGSQGALLYVEKDGFMETIPAFYNEKMRNERPVINTVGAGDALFSTFVHFYAKNANPYDALKYAQAFASWKIGASGGAEGFLSEADLLSLVNLSLVKK